MNPDWDARHKERWERRRNRWSGGCGPKPLSGVLFGLLLIGGGLLFLLRNLGVVYIEDIGQYWPVILIVIGASKLIAPRGSHDVTSGLIIGGIGTLFLLRNLGILYGSVWGYIWPGVFIAIGFSMLMRNIYGPTWRSGVTVSAGDVGTTDANTLQADVLFGGIDRKVVSQAFEGGRVAVMFGGADIDLRGAAMQKPEIVLSADAVFGGIELKVPESWQVEMRGSGIFGGYEDRTHHPPPSLTGQAPKLIVKGSAVFGGVSVRN